MPSTLVKAWKLIYDKGSEKSKAKLGTKPRWMERLEEKMDLSTKTNFLDLPRNEKNPPKWRVNIETSKE